ncbi:uncharacterized protein TNCV_1961 [Trichonephila clavipes]|nr:uncharacterized protein TNCV_1961 [Trichonephila clavipes]
MLPDYNTSSSRIFFFRPPFFRHRFPFLPRSDSLSLSLPGPSLYIVSRSTCCQGAIRDARLTTPRKNILFFGRIFPEISIKDVPDRLESTVTTFAGPSTTSLCPKSSILQTNRRTTPSSKNNNHVKFVTPATTLDVSHTMKVDVVLHQIATCAAESIGADINSCTQWKSEESPQLQRIETGVELDSPKLDSPR